MKKRDHLIENGVEKKYCIDCNSYLDLSLFSISIQKWDRLSTLCKICQQTFYTNKKERKVTKKRQLHRSSEIGELKLCSSCKEWLCLSSFSKSGWHWDNLAPLCKTCQKRWRDTHKEQTKINMQRWRKDNKPRVRELAQRCHEKRKNNIQNRLNNSFRTQIGVSLKGNKNGAHCFDLVPYTLNDLYKHLESLWKEGMLWKNYGKGVGKWNIDHIRPVVSFNFFSDTDKEFQECWALNNLEPSWSTTNSSKNSIWMGKKYTKYINP